MGIFGLSLPKKKDVGNVFGAVTRGASRAYDTANPFDAGLSWSTRTVAPQQAQQSVLQQGANNIVKPLVRAPVQTANTLRAGVGGAYGLGKIGISSTFGTDQGYQNTVTGVQQSLNRDLSPKSGLFGMGTLFKSPEEAYNITPRQLAGKSLNTGTQLAQFVAPQLRIFKNPVTNRVVNNAGQSLTGSVVGQAVETGRVDPKQTFIDTAAGTAFGEVVPAARGIVRATAKRAPLNEGGYVQVGRTPKNIHPEDQATMADFVDHARGVTKFSPRIAQELELQAAHIAERYGLKMPPSTKGLANEFAKRLDKEGFGTKMANKVKSSVRALGQDEGGAVMIPGKKRVVEGEVIPPKKGKVTVRPAKNSTLQEVKRGLSDQDQVILDELRSIEKQTGQKGLVDKFMYNSNIQRGSNARANVMLQTSENIKGAIGGLKKKDYENFSDYANARTELASALRAKGKKFRTSRPVEELEAIVKAGEGIHGQRFKALNQHYKELAQVAKDAGIIDDKTFKYYTKNDDYIRLQRDMDDLVPSPYGRGNSYQLGSTTLKQKRKGSTRAAMDAGEVAAERTQQIYREAAKNKTGTQLVDTLKTAGLAKKLSAKQAQNRNTVGIFRNGKKEFYEVSPEIKVAMDNINPYHMNVVMKILAGPGRVLRAGVTGLNPVFIARNLIKDQFGSAINSKSMAATHNPKVFFQGLFNASADAVGMSKNPLYKDFLKHYGDQTSFDLTRNIKDTRAVIARVRGGKKEGLKQGLKSPIRSLENFAAITEKSTRFQNYVGEYKKAIKQGLTKDQASERAAMAAWQNSVDFSRAGTWGRVINTVVPYWNPATQGVRQMGRTFKNQPIKSTFAGTALIGVPLVAATSWNMSDEATKAIYDNIPDFEKDNNLILIPPGTTQNEDGSYDVVKIPLPPGFKDVFMPLRRAMESYAGDKPLEGKEIAQDLLQVVSGPVQTRGGSQFVGSFIPQIAKPGIQQGMNRDLFTGKDIVPEYMNEALDAQGNPIPEEKKAYAHSSGTARVIAGALNTSPIRVEKFIKDAAGTVGLNVLGAADAGVKGDVGGVATSLAGGKGWERSFEKAQGIENYNKSEGAKYFDRVKEAQKGLNANEKAAYDSLHPAKKNFLGEQIYEHDATYDPVARLDIYNRFPKVYEADKKLDQDNRNAGKPGNPLFDLKEWQLKKVLEKENLPPGADDPELSQLYDKEWYSDYRTKKTTFFNQLKAQSEKEGKPFGKSDNPYPETPPNVQRAMDFYSALPKGTGERSAWIRSNPGVWAAMQKQFAMVDNWQNIARGKRGLDMTEGAVGQAAGYSSGSTSYGGGKARVFNAEDYIKRYSIGGGDVTKGTSKRSSKASVSVRKRSPGKVRVKSAKLRLA